MGGTHPTEMLFEFLQKGFALCTLRIPFLNTIYNNNNPHIINPSKYENNCLNQVVKQDLLKEAIRYAESVADKPHKHRIVRHMKVKDAHRAQELMEGGTQMRQHYY